MNSKADIFYKCRADGVCLGSQIEFYRTGNQKIVPVGTCAYPYTGNVCNNCIDGYGKSNDGSECIDCQRSPKIYLQILAVIFTVLIIVLAGQKTTFHAERLDGFANYFMKNKLTTRVALVRIFINFVQMIGIIGSVEIAWNGGLKRVTRVDESVTIAHSDVFGLGCSYSQFGSDTGIRKIYMKTLLTNFLLIFYLAMVILCWTIYFKYFKK